MWATICVVGALLSAVLFSVVATAPQVADSATTHAGLYSLFCDSYWNPSREDVEIRVTSLERACGVLDDVAAAYFSAPIAAPGVLRHVLEGSGAVARPQVTVSYVLPGTTSETVVGAVLNETQTIASVVRLLIGQHEVAYYLIRLELFVTVLLCPLGSEQAASCEVWTGTFSGRMDLHQSVMTIRGEFVAQHLAGPEERFAAHCVFVVLQVLLCLVGIQEARHSQRPCLASLVALAVSLVAPVAAALRVLSWLDDDVALALLRLSLSVSVVALSVAVASDCIAFHFSSCAVVLRAIAISAPHLSWYIVGVLPIFLGFALGGVALFSSASEHFSTLGKACVTLFCCVFGDSLLDVFTSLDERDSSLLWWVQSRAFFVCFILLFITSVLNVGLSVLQESHALAKGSTVECGERPPRQ